MGLSADSLELVEAWRAIGLPCGAPELHSCGRRVVASRDGSGREGVRLRWSGSRGGEGEEIGAGDGVSVRPAQHRPRR